MKWMQGGFRWFMYSSCIGLAFVFGLHCEPQIPCSTQQCESSSQREQIRDGFKESIRTERQTHEQDAAPRHPEKRREQLPEFSKPSESQEPLVREFRMLDSSEPIFDSVPSPPENLPKQRISFQESTKPILNPERGLYLHHYQNDPLDFAKVRTRGFSLIMLLVRLRPFRDKPITQTLLRSLEHSFKNARTAGVKYILRFAYNYGETWPKPSGDAPKSRILSHIQQLRTLLQKYSDIIAIVQAGFIGEWGEMHSSTHGLGRSNLKERREILEALLRAVPKSRTVSVRYPWDKIRMFNNQALTSQEAFLSTNKARISHWNDCFLSGADDVGTYHVEHLGNQILKQRPYVAQETQFVPIGGESCAVFPKRTDCAHAEKELRQLHYVYLNSGYHTQVLKRWRTQGCYARIVRRLGYRFVLRSIQLPLQLRKGKTFNFKMEWINRGYASMYTERPVFLQLKQGSVVRHQWRLTGTTWDPRRWWNGKILHGQSTLSIPSSIQAGRYTLSLWMPDPSPHLHKRPEYAVQWANLNVWDAKTGSNTLLSNLQILD